MGYTVKFGSVKYDMLPNGFEVYKDRIVIRIFGTNVSVDEMEEQLSNPSNLKLIEMFLEEGGTTTALGKYTQFNILHDIRKTPNVELQRYSEDMLLERETFDQIEITIRTIEPADIVPKIQSDLEYIAILSDIDLDEDIYQ